jgi:hypothetical protein
MLVPYVSVYDSSWLLNYLLCNFVHMSCLLALCIVISCNFNGFQIHKPFNSNYRVWEFWDLP